MSLFVGRGSIKIGPRTLVNGTMPSVFLFIGNAPTFSVNPGVGYARYAVNCPKFIKSGDSPDLELELDDLNTNVIDQLFYSNHTTSGGISSLGLFTTDHSEYCWLRFEGHNIVDNSNVTIDIPKVKLSLPDRFPILSDDFTKFRITGKISLERRIIDSFFVANYGRIMKFTGKL